MTEQEVISIAKLVNLLLSPKEIANFQVTIPETLKVIDVLKELDTKDVSPTTQVTGLHNVFMDKETVTTISQELALSNAAEVAKGLFVTKAVFDRT